MVQLAIFFKIEARFSRYVHCLLEKCIWFYRAVVLKKMAGLCVGDASLSCKEKEMQCIQN